MKHTIKAALIIVFCCIAACTEQKTERYRQLEYIDTLSRNTLYDSAKILLDSVGATQTTDKEIALYNLLAIRLYGPEAYSSVLDSMLNYSEIVFTQTHETNYLAEVYLYKGDNCHFFKNDYDSSEYYVNLCKTLASQGTQDHFLLSQVYWYKMLLHIQSGNLQTIVDDAKKQTAHAEKSKNKRQIAYGELNTVTSLKLTGTTDELDLHIQAALNWKDYLRPQDLAFVYNVYGELVIDNNPETAKEIFTKALEICPESALTKKNLAQLYYKQGDIKQAEFFCDNCSYAYWSEDKIDVLNILAECKMASGDLYGTINIKNKIISEKDSIIKRIQNSKQIIENQNPSTTTNEKEIITWAIITVVSLIFCAILIQKLRNTQQDYKKLKQELTFEKTINQNIKQPGEELYKQLMKGKKIAQWDKKTQMQFLEYFKAKHPDVIEKIETKYETPTPHYLIFLILQKIGKKQKEIEEIMSISESGYYSIVSRTKKKQKQ